ncbi:hypothetical protein CPC08DRAFT_818147 [Agrocybe pediades]|nr:hypothetical protein CPC08DRAFT_818147 [Agrocybe pediades]
MKLQKVYSPTSDVAIVSGIHVYAVEKRRLRAVSSLFEIIFDDPGPTHPRVNLPAIGPVPLYRMEPSKRRLEFLLDAIFEPSSLVTKLNQTICDSLKSALMLYSSATKYEVQFLIEEAVRYFDSYFEASKFDPTLDNEEAVILTLKVLDKVCVTGGYTWLFPRVFELAASLPFDTLKNCKEWRKLGESTQLRLAEFMVERGRVVSRVHSVWVSSLPSPSCKSRAGCREKLRQFVWKYSAGCSPAGSTKRLNTEEHVQLCERCHEYSLAVHAQMSTVRWQLTLPLLGWSSDDLVAERAAFFDKVQDEEYGRLYTLERNIRPGNSPMMLQWYFMPTAFGRMFGPQLSL